MKRILLLLLPLLALPALGQPSPGVPPTRIIAGSGIAVTTNGFNNFTLATSIATTNTPLLNGTNDWTGTNNFTAKVIATNTANVFAGDGSGLTGIAGGILTSNGLGTNTVLKATLGTTNWGLRVYGSNHTSSMYVNEDAKVGSTMFGAANMNALSFGSLSIYSGSTVDSPGSRYWYATGNGGTPYVLGVSTWLLTWSSSSSNPDATDTAITRNAANTLELHSGTAGVANRGTLLAAKYTGRAGTSTTTFNAGGVLWYDVTPTGNVGSGADVILTNNIGTNVFASNGDSVDIILRGNYAATAGSKQIILNLAGQALFDSGVLAAATTNGWHIDALLIRTGASTIESSVKFVPDNAGLGFYPQVVNRTITVGLTTNNPVTLTGESSGTPADNDIVRKIARAEFKPAP